MTRSITSIIDNFVDGKRVYSVAPHKWCGTTLSMEKFACLSDALAYAKTKGYTHYVGLFMPSSKAYPIP